MASISSTINIVDRMSLPLQNIIAAVGGVIDSMQSVDGATDQAFGGSAIIEAKQKLGLANAELAEMVQRTRQNAAAQGEHNKQINAGRSGLDGMLGKIAGMAGAYMGIGKIFNLSDQMTMTDARLNLTVDDGGSLEEYKAKIMQSANDARAVYANRRHGFKAGAKGGRRIGFMTGVYWVLDLWDTFMLKSKIVCAAVDGFIGDMRANVQLSLQGMVNGAICIINDFITLLNKIPGVSIDTIQNVTFGTAEQLRNEAAKKAREQELKDYSLNVSRNIDSREAEISRMTAEAMSATNKRQADIEAKVSGMSGGGQDNLIPGAEVAAAGIDQIAANTDAIADSLEITEDELKYLRDIAEQETINRYTTAEIKLDMTNNNTISSENDVDGIINYMVTGLQEAMQTAAEGGHE